MDNYFKLLNDVDVSEHIEKKGKLSYLSWAWAWDQFKRKFPDSYYTIYETANGCPYHTDGNTCWVKTGVTLVDGDFRLEHIEYLPVMDFKNKSIPLDCITSTDANKAIQRSLTKAVARHGLGLYIYAGEDLPEQEIPINGTPADKPPADYKPEAPRKATITAHKISVCADCGKPITGVMKDGTLIMQPDEVAKETEKVYGVPLCVACGKKRKAGK